MNNLTVNIKYKFNKYPKIKPTVFFCYSFKQCYYFFYMYVLCKYSVAQQRAIVRK